MIIVYGEKKDNPVVADATLVGDVVYNMATGEMTYLHGRSNPFRPAMRVTDRGVGRSVCIEQRMQPLSA